MKRMTYKALVKKVNDGKCAVISWANDTDGTFAVVCFYKGLTSSPSETVEVTNVPVEVKQGK